MRHPLPTLTLGLAMVIGVSASAPARADWPAGGRAICDFAGDQVAPAMLSNGAGGAIVVWEDYRGGGPGIFALQVMSSGDLDPAWPATGRPVCALASSQVRPVIAGDGAGGAIVAWEDHRGGNADIYAQHVLANGEIDPLWPADGRAIGASSGDQSRPVVVPDESGGALVAWEHGGPAGLDVYVHHVLASGALDPAWPSGGRALCTAAGHQRAPRMVADGTGGAFLAWADERNGLLGTDYYAHHVSASGTADPTWPVDGRRIGALALDQPACLLADGSGGVFVAWSGRKDPTGSHVFAQHLLANGSTDPSWPADGRDVTPATTAFSRGNVRMVSDGTAGAIIAWDEPSPDLPDVYAQHVLGSGAADPAWPANGRNLTNYFYQQAASTLTSDGAGGAIVAYVDARGGAANVDVYGQHVLAFGVLHPAWPADGLPLCTAIHGQSDPQSVTDGAGGALIAWQDSRSGTNADLYITRIQADVVGAPPRGTPGEVSLSRPEPNPSRGGPVTLRYTLSREGPVSLSIHDAAGRRVRRLVSGHEGAGTHPIVWDVRDDSGSPVGAGVYYVRLDAGGQRLSRRLVTFE